jgi:hypothetical protein
MFGHQDHTDNNDNPDQDNQAEIDSHIQEFNNSNDQPSSTAPVDNSQPAAMPPIPPALPVHGTSSQQVVNLPDAPKDKVADLVDLKSKALDELYPIIHKLDLSAEDNFKTLMMMIQATDNKDLIGQAYEAAEKIEDESARAKALLDIVNEINYFTNHPSIDQ